MMLVIDVVFLIQRSSFGGINEGPSFAFVASDPTLRFFSIPLGLLLQFPETPLAALGLIAELALLKVLLKEQPTGGGH
jgi:hypothetical protein